MLKPTTVCAAGIEYCHTLLGDIGDINGCENEFVCMVEKHFMLDLETR